MNIINMGSYQIAVDEKYIVLSYGRRSEWMTYGDELIKILEKWRLHLWVEERSFRTYVYGRNRERTNFRIYDLAMANYLGIVHADTLLEDLQIYFSMKNRVLSVDHADNDHRNNTALNLSLMPKQLNAVKDDITARFINPYGLNTAFCDGKYLVEFSQVHDGAFIQRQLDRIGLGFIHIGADGVAVMRFVCDTPESYVELLNTLYQTRIEGGKIEERPLEHFKKKVEDSSFPDSRRYMANLVSEHDTVKSICEQERLARLDKSVFQWVS